LLIPERGKWDRSGKNKISINYAASEPRFRIYRTEKRQIGPGQITQSPVWIVLIGRMLSNELGNLFVGALERVAGEVATNLPTK
jgi:hypothetical protein